MRETLLDTLDDFERRGNDAAYAFPRGYRHERWSYRQVADAANQFARELQSRNISQGDAVLLWTPNCAEWVVAFFGCALAGVIAVPIDDASHPDFARRISEQVATRMVLCARERAATFHFGGNPTPASIPTIDPTELVPLLSRHSAQPFRPVEVRPSDTLEIVFTSGTTAEPKGVVITHANVIGNVAPIESEVKKYLKYERLVHPIRFLNLLPLSHMFGQFLGIFLPPLLGGVVVFEDSFNPTDIISTIRRERVSVLVSVPRVIASLQQKIERDLEAIGQLQKFSSRYQAATGQHFPRRWWTFRAQRRQFGWKFWAMISGGAALDRETEEFWHRLGYAVIQGYGLTETTSLVSLNHPFHTSRGSIGKVLPGREIKLAEDGEILVRGSGVASGYWSGRELQPVARSEDEGWYRTGDLGALDEENNLFFRGRKKDVIVTVGGMNIYPEDLEAALRQQKEIRDCVVVGLDRGGNAEPCAVLILRDRGAGNNTAEVMDDAAQTAVQRANQTLAEYQRMRRWFLWPDQDFPRSATQKPKRNVIRAAVEASIRGNSSAEIASPLAELLSRITRRPGQTFTSQSNLENGLGLSSLERVELLGAIEDRYQIDLSETNLAKVATVGDLERLLHANRGPQQSDSSAPSRMREARAGFHYPHWVLRWPITWLRTAAQYLLMCPAVFLLGRPRVIGRDNLLAVSGPLLIVSNHISDVDFGLIEFSLPARIRHKIATATAGETLEKLRSPDDSRMLLARIYDRLRWALAVALLNLYPLPRESGFRKSFAYAGEAVDRGYSILVFPEGKHSPDGSIGQFRTGIGLLANNLRIPLLPMRIDGLFDLKKTGKFAARDQIRILIGKPIQFSPETAPEEIAEVLKKLVEDLGK
jgi:long-chain acyl-CoA synthetase